MPNLSPVLKQEIDDQQVTKYRNGGCFAMAEALHRLTGFPIRCIDFGRCTHAFVVSPDNEVMDIHGVMHWNTFLAFMVAEGVLPAYAVADDLIQAQDVPNPPPTLWLHMGYKVPSETAVKDAIAVVRTHPALASVLSKLTACRFAPPSLPAERGPHTKDAPHHERPTSKQDLASAGECRQNDASLFISNGP